MELVAGAANILSPMFRNPGHRAIARTATNVKTGENPVAGIVHSVVLLLVMLVFGHWVSNACPRCNPAGCRLQHERMAFVCQADEVSAERRRGDAGDVALTIIVDLTVAIQVV
jgi:SulP family sulfate permease